MLHNGGVESLLNPLGGSFTSICYKSLAEELDFALQGADFLISWIFAFVPHQPK